MKVCSVEGCDRVVLARNLCSLHYQRFMRHGSPADPIPKICSINGCLIRVMALGLCAKHYQRQSKNGTQELKRIRKYEVGVVCSVPSCLAGPVAKGLCPRHYYLHHSGQSLDTPIHIPQPPQPPKKKPSNDRGGDSRICDGCENIKPNSAFYQHPTRKFYDRYCSECKTKRARISHVLRKYGEEGLLLQEKIDAGAVCEICGKLFGNNMMSIDHDHTTGKVCGILCRNCNSAIGQLGDTEELILKALEYVRRTRP